MTTPATSPPPSQGERWKRLLEKKKEKEKRNSQGKDPRTFDENSQGGDLRTPETNSQGEDPRTFKESVERWRVQKKRKEKQWKKKKKRKEKKKKAKYRRRAWWKKCNERVASFLTVKRKEEEKEKKGRKCDKSHRTRQVFGKSGRWLFLLLLLVQTWICVNAAAEGLQKRTDDGKVGRCAEDIPQRWKQPKGEDRTELKREAKLLRCTLVQRGST